MIATSESGSFVSIDVGVGVWVFLSALIAALLLIDLLVVHRKSHVITTRRALIESIVWISVGIGFSFFVLAQFGGEATGEYLSAYLIEKSLSIDNVFVWSVILTHYRVPEQYQHRVLFWGIFGALAMRLGFILAGVAVIERFEFTMVLFGAFLLWTGAKLFRGDDEFDPAESKPMKVFHRFIPSVDQLDGQKLITRHLGRRVATPLLAVLVLIELTDLLFAVDSVPAVLAISREQFIAFSSNAFAILGLRALYFVLADIRHRFEYLEQGIAAILVFVGVKMSISPWWHLPTFVSLAVIAVILFVAIMWSLRHTRIHAHPAPQWPDESTH
ncbi:MAG: TerC/Alx family metal homeostasis membrane protein [Actinobacteria bacterium]|nr:TerC/Alx family metal homeostasis membrane protein [Actinomycetota bacterium]NBP53196.1 TerC/Alx family metal homeostasis membrane protein [Actinomycetota bacterium]